MTADLPGIGGVIKEQVQDFLVEELPLYPASGQGEHTFFEIEKTGLSTFEAVRLIAQALGLSPNRISHAGLKDARAITCQVLSVHNVAPEAVLALVRNRYTTGEIINLGLNSPDGSVSA
ncbi:MAG: tRNA pseudouridine(13) synthase TruD, partial [Anaerolineae bacterium]